MATIIAAHDLSGVGRCSLTAALAVLPAFGHTCYPLPTAVLSQQTGLSGYSFLDMTDHLPDYLKGWRGLKISPDLIYTGFLGNARQAAMLSAFMAEHPNAVTIVDPVMGDGGGLYDCYDEGFVSHIRGLSRSADILLPNMTEFNLLCGLPGARELPRGCDELVSLALGLGAPRLRHVVVTSAVYRGENCNLIIDVADKDVTAMPFRHSGSSYGGAGDLFASAICALVADSESLPKAVHLAANFVSEAINATPSDSDPRFGICYEPLLCGFRSSIDRSGDI